jgi:hypothetical protein
MIGEGAAFVTWKIHSHPSCSDDCEIFDALRNVHLLPEVGTTEVAEKSVFADLDSFVAIGKMDTDNVRGHGGLLKEFPPQRAVISVRDSVSCYVWHGRFLRSRKFL